MIMLHVQFQLAGHDGALQVALHPSYGEDPFAVHDLVGAALVSSESPVVVDCSGAILRFPAKSVKAYATWRYFGTG